MALKPITNDVTVFYGQNRKLTLSLLINGVKRIVCFADHLFETADPDEIRAIRDIIDLYKKKNLIPNVYEKNEWEELQAREPKEVTIEVAGEKFKVDINELKGNYVETVLKPKMQNAGKDKIKIGSIGTGEGK